jgi:MoxR-like ATPase
VELHCEQPARGFVELAVQRFQVLRKQGGFKKLPATGELIAWVRVLQRMGYDAARLRAVETRELPALETLLKTREDLRRAQGD